MKDSLYAYSSYKTYLRDRLEQEGRGARLRLAQAMGSQLAYLSQVLNADRDLSVDQAEAATRYLGLGIEDAEYFVTLVEWARAGTPGARKLFARQLERKRTQFMAFQRRVDIAEELSEADKAIYYGNYLYAAVHMLLTIPEFRTVESIATRLQQTSTHIQRILEFLKSRHLVIEERQRWSPGTRYLFIDKGSPYIAQHHVNWRLQAAQSAVKRTEEDLHLSMVVTLSVADAELLKQRMASFVEEVSGTIKRSKEERLMTLNLDFFAV